MSASAAGGPGAGFTNKPVGSATMPCSAGGGAPEATPASDLAKTTPSYENLPQSITLSEQATTSMRELWEGSFDEKGNSVERGGTLALDKDGNLVVVNKSGGTASSFTPSTSVPADHTYVGTFHTHPYGKNDGSWDGAQLPFSDGDVATFDDFNENLSAVQSKDTVYVLVRTDQTPSTITDSAAKKVYDKVFDAEYDKQLKAGKSDAEAASIAGEKATAALAQHYKLGYYKGKNSGKLWRVNP